jgi:tRNA dimethylallyltransferase
VARWLEEARAAERAVAARGARALFVGGTMFYLKALVAGLFEGPDADPGLRAALEERYEREGAAALHAELARDDPASARRIHPNDRKRLVRALEVQAQTGRPLSAHQTAWGLHGAPPAPSPRPRRLVALTRPPEELERRIRARVERMLDAGWAEEVEALRAAGGFSRTAAQALGYAEVLALVEGRLDRAACVERITVRTRRFARKQRTWLRGFPELAWVELEANEDPRLRADEVLALLGLAAR